MGAIDVPAEHYWAAQTQRSLHHFDIGRESRARKDAFKKVVTQ